jgi:hypothetical protein
LREERENHLKALRREKVFGRQYSNHIKVNLGVNEYVLIREVQYRWFCPSNMAKKKNYDLIWFDLWFFN